MQLSIALDFFLGSCYIKGLLERSIDNYDKFVNRFIKSVGNLELEDLKYPVIEKYLQDLYKSNLSKATVGTYIRHLRVFLKYLETEGYIEVISDRVKPPRLHKKLVKVYTDDEIKMIFEIIDIKPAWLKYRNCCIISFMLDSGLRLNEVCGINLSDYDFKQNFIKVYGKGEKERLVPVGHHTRYYLKKYLSSLPKYVSDQKPIALFVNRNGKRLTRNTVKLLVQKMGYQLPFEFSSHKLRHNFATNYCLDEYKKNGQVDIYRLMILLGHEDIKTTKYYLHMANQVIISNSNISHLDKVFSPEPLT